MPREDFGTSVRREIDAMLDKIEPGLRKGKFKGLTPEERLLKRRERKKRGLRAHTRAFTVVNSFLFLLWGLLSLMSGAFLPPFFMFVLLGWGMGYTFHVLGHRSWLSEHRGALRAAEVKALPAHARAGSDWDDWLERCTSTMEVTRKSLKGHPDAAALLARLDDSEAQLASLVDGARELESTRAQLAPDGLEGVDREIAKLEAQEAAADVRLREVHRQNRELLQRRRERLAELEVELERIRGTLQGFILAAENFRLDALSFARGEVDPDALREPIRQLQDEIEVMERVRSEMRDLTGSRTP